MLKNVFYLTSLSILFSLMVFAQVNNEKKYKTTGEVHRENHVINDLIEKDAEIEILAEGFVWSEGPVWIKDGGYVLFSDVPQNTIYKWKEEEGLSVYLRPSGYAIGDDIAGEEVGSNGLFVNPVNNKLILCDHGNRSVTELNQENWIKKIIVNTFEGKRFNSPNDIAISSKGDFYFTDPPYGLSFPDFPEKELDFSGVYHLKPDGKIKLITKELDYPNGIALSPDEKTLYVSNSGDKKIWMAFDISGEGDVSNGRIFYDATEFNKYGKDGGCDGMAVDEKGNLWATGPGGVMIFTPGGEYLGSIDTGTLVANCAFGGKDGNELYIASDEYLCRIRVKIKGSTF